MKNIINSNKGLAAGALIGIIAGILILGGAIYFATADKTATPENTDNAVMDDDRMDGDAMMDDDGTMLKYTGEVLAGNESKLLDFSQVDYETALKTDKLIVLYFYADWCPDCKAEFPRMQAAFDELSSEDVIAFRVNYKDDFTDEHEEALAKEHGIAYQHTKVFIKNGERILKAPDTWDEFRYLSEVNQYLTSN